MLNMNIILSYLNFIKILFICSIAIFFTCILYFFINSPLAFQKIMSSVFVREQFGIKSDADLTLSQEGELALFTWMFKNPHNNLTAENNTNLWPAARATDEWNKLNAYDIANGTHFAASYDVSDPEAATERMDVLINKMVLHHNGQGK